MSKRLLKLGLLLIVACIVQTNARCDESPDDKLKAYKLAKELRTQLLVSIRENQEVIQYLEQKSKYYKPSANKGDPTAKKIVQEFEAQKDQYSDNLEAVERKLKGINDLIDKLKKDADVGTLVSAEEISNEVSEKMKNVSDLLPKID